MEATRGEQTISQIAARFEVHPSQVNLWKKQALQQLTEAFSTRHASLPSLPVPAGVKKLNSAFLLDKILIVVDALYY